MTKDELRMELIALICEVTWEYDENCKFSTDDHADRFLELIERFCEGTTPARGK
jgi:hypothetical protein